MGERRTKRLSRLHAQRIATALAGLGRQPNAERPRSLRAEMGERRDAREPWTAQPEILAFLGRGQEARLCGLVPLQRRPEFRAGAARDAAIEDARRIAVREC